VEAVAAPPRWPSGAVAHAFSAEDPDSLRGPQFEAAWADELGKWRYAQETWDMLQFGLRLGARPRQAVTTTPRTIPLIRRLVDAPGVVTTTARTADNAGNLAPGFLAQVTDWVTGHEPMTGAQASYLKTLSEEARDPDAFDPELEKAEASKRIDALKQETGR
jgi:phage terminase large subunit-like protein